VLKTRYGYDGREYNDATYCVISCFGLLTTGDDLGAFSALGSGGWDLSVLDNVRTKTGYHANTTQWLFPPKYVASIGLSDSTLLSCTRS
jgi:hypothetical protein